MAGEPVARERSVAERRRRMMRLGGAVFAGLIILDVVEYAVSQVAGQLLLWLSILAVPQAGLIVVFYMHVLQLRRREKDR